MAESNEYKEIVELYDYCKKIGVCAKIEDLWNGYAIRFKNGGDVVQHGGSYGSSCGCVEPAIGNRLDYTAVSLERAKSLILRHKTKLNGLKGGESE